MPIVPARGAPDPTPGAPRFRSPRPLSRISWTMPPRDLSSLERAMYRGVVNALHGVARQVAREEIAAYIEQAILDGQVDPIPAAIYAELEQTVANAIQDALLDEVITYGVEHLDEIIRRYAVGNGARASIRSAILGNQARRELTGEPVVDVLGRYPQIPRVAPPRGFRFLDPTHPPADAYLNLRFDLVNPYAIDFARNAAYRLAGHVRRTTVDSVRSTVTNAVAGQLELDEAVGQVQSVLGLFPRWARAVDNYYRGLRSRGADVAFARKQADRYASHLRQKRAMMVTRTEVMRAQNYGRMAAWNAAGGAGLLDVASVEKEWLTGPHVAQESKVNRQVTGPCEVCGPMDGKRVTGVEGLFLLPNSMQTPTPPAHPHCRCTVLIHPPEPPEWLDEEMVEVLVEWRG